jgi:transposase InsO family protein
MICSGVCLCLFTCFGPPLPIVAGGKDSQTGRTDFRESGQLRAHRRPDLVERDFSASGPDRLWVGDFTYLRSWEGSLFFSFVIDAFSRKVVGWQLASHMRTDLVLDALKMALGQREPGADVALVAHTDRGSQYTSADYTQTLDDHGVLASVGSVGDAFDNAMAESFVDTFKTELIADRSWRSRTQLELAVVEYIAWFNNDRLHEALVDLPPAEFESLYVAQGSQLSYLQRNHQSRSP